jgi:tRNA(Met) cytidine acetyltransferase
MDGLGRRLRAEAKHTNQRRMLVLTGTPEQTRDAAKRALDEASISTDSTALIGPDDWLGGSHHTPARATELLGRTIEAVVVDATETLRPNALGAATGAVDGGGLLILCAPPLSGWATDPDGFDDRLAVPPDTVADVTGHFRQRLVETLRAHRGIAIVDVDSGSVKANGLTDPPPRLPADPPAVPTGSDFPDAAFRACHTADQATAVAAFEPLSEPGHALVLEADRGRGKSSAAGLAAACLAWDGADVLVTAPQYTGAQEIFKRAQELAEETERALTVASEVAPTELTTEAGCIRFADPAAAVKQAGDVDILIVDEAAGLPVRVLEQTLAAPSVAYATTVHGYEGAGRGFSVRFQDTLMGSSFAVEERTLTTPIRYACADPVETWAFRALLLDARPAVPALLDGSTLDDVGYEALDSARLLDDEHLLREAFGLLVTAHYRTEPDDLARLLDAPNVSVRALRWEGHVLSVALLAREGGLPADLREEMYDGARVKGNMIPDICTTQLRDPAAGVPVGQRVLRIATHPALRSQGFGSRLLTEVRAEFGPQVDWLGVGFGATPSLVSFWADNGYQTIHLSTTRNDTSGEYSAIMLDPCSADGRAFCERHTAWFQRRIGPMLADPIDDMDPAVVRTALGAVETTYDYAFSAWERRVIEGIATGTTTYDSNPGPFKQLAMTALFGRDGSTDLSDRHWTLLVRKGLQGNDWAAIAEECGFVSTAECMRTFGEVMQTVYAEFTAGGSTEGDADE